MQHRPEIPVTIGVHGDWAASHKRADLAAHVNGAIGSDHKLTFLG